MDYELDADDSEDSELLLDELDSEDSELALDELDSEDSELALDELEEEDSGPVGLPLLQPPRAPTPASAAPPESRIRNWRLSDRRESSGAASESSVLSVITPLPRHLGFISMAVAGVNLFRLAVEQTA